MLWHGMQLQGKLPWLADSSVEALKQRHYCRWLHIWCPFTWPMCAVTLCTLSILLKCTHGVFGSIQPQCGVLQLNCCNTKHSTVCAHGSETHWYAVTHVTQTVCGCIGGVCVRNVRRQKGLPKKQPILFAYIPCTHSRNNTQTAPIWMKETALLIALQHTGAHHTACASANRRWRTSDPARLGSRPWHLPARLAPIGYLSLACTW